MYDAPPTFAQQWTVRQLAAGAGCWTQAQRARVRHDQRINDRRLSTGRGRAWRNTLVAAINAGIEQDLFGQWPGENYWPGYRPRPETGGHMFDFIVEGIPALAYVSDAGWDELLINVALWPATTARRWLFCGNITNHKAASDVGDVIATGWMERRDGIYLQPSPSLFFCRRERKARVAALDIEPHGYADRGRFRL